MMEEMEVMTGNEAAAYGAKLSRVSVVAAYPITPQTSLVEKIQSLINSRELEAEYINVESEHSAMGSCIGASVGGARAFTATSSQGLLLMQEMLFWAGYGRLPIVMSVVTRSIAPPWNMWSEHTDALSQRDSGWIQIFCHTSQEILDTVIQAYRIAEDKRVLLPVMVCFDGFEISHTAQNVLVPEQSKVDNFLPRCDNSLIDRSRPKLLWNGVFPDRATGFREALWETMKNALPVIEEINGEFEKEFGRGYDSLELYGSPEPDMLVVAMGSLASTAKSVIDALTHKGLRVALARVRIFSPFPSEKLRILAGRARAVAIFDRDISFNGGILATQVKAALFGTEKPRPKLFEFFAGMGGQLLKSSSFMIAIETIMSSIDSESSGTKEQRAEGVIWLK